MNIEENKMCVTGGNRTQALTFMLLLIRASLTNEPQGSLSLPMITTSRTRATFGGPDKLNFAPELLCDPGGP